MYSLVLLSIIFRDKLAPNRPPCLIYVTRLPRKVTLATFHPPLPLAMTDRGLCATGHVGHLYLRLANPGRTGIARSLHIATDRLICDPNTSCLGRPGSVPYVSFRAGRMDDSYRLVMSADRPGPCRSVIGSRLSHGECGAWLIQPMRGLAADS